MATNKVSPSSLYIVIHIDYLQTEPEIVLNFCMCKISLASQVLRLSPVWTCVATQILVSDIHYFFARLGRG